MQKRTKFRSPLIDFTVVLLCLSVSAFSIWLFWKDLNKTSVRNDQDSIATISFKHNIAQRKFSDRIVWERIKQNSPLYDKDIIRTADFAQATIHFKDGTSLDVFENSMIQISKAEDGSVRLSIEGGDVQVEAGQNSQAVEVQLSDGSKVNMDAGGSIALKSDSSSGVQNIEVKGGSAKVTSESGQTQAVTFGESVNIEKGGEIKINPVTVITPPKEKRLLNLRGKSIPVNFEWRINGDEDSVVIETSSSRDFEKIITKERISSAHNAEIPVSSGTLYWRVYTDSTKDRPSQGKIMVERVPEISVVSPASDSQFRYRSAKPRINFRWQGNSFADHYRLIIAASADMANPLADINTEASFANVDTLGEGTYYWQVMPYYSLNDIGYDQPSPAKKIQIIRNEFIAPPQLSSPADGSELTYKDSLAANFLWKSEIPGNFELLLSKDNRFEKIVYKKETSLNRLSEEFNSSKSDSLTLADGLYFWKIVRHSEDAEDVKNESEVRTFKVERYKPQSNTLLYPADNFSAESDKLVMTEFIWRLSDDYPAGTKSIFQLSKTRDFASVLIEKTCDKPVFTELSLDMGSYYWRIGAASENGSIENPTGARKITVLAGLGSPVFISPLQDEEVLVYGEREANISWQLVKGADYYNVKIYDPAKQLVAQKSSVEGQKTSFPLDAGSYICRIQAVSEIAGTSSIRMGEVVERAFRVRKPSVIQTLSPAENAHISGLTALKSLTVFKWQNGRDRAKSFDFVLQRLLPNGNYKIVERRTGLSSLTTSLSRLTAGKYRWQIQARSVDGIPVNSEFAEFTVAPVASLPKPLLLNPENGITIGSQYLKNHRTLNFSWQKVPEATAYSFQLYRQSPDGSLKAVHTRKNMKETSLVIRDLSILDIGNFVWNVSAYSYASDGYLEQSSDAARGHFRIYFGLPDTVEAIKPETMYAE